MKLNYQLTSQIPFRLTGERGVYLNTLLFSLAMNLLYLFIPIYVFQLTGRLESAFLFYSLAHVGVILSVILAGKSAQKIGVDWTAFIGLVIRVIFLLFLIFAKTNLSLLWPAAFLYGVAVAFYWLAFHYTVIGAEDGDGKFGKETSLIKIIQKITASFGPLIGGLVIAGLGFGWLYLLAIFLVIASAAPLFLDEFAKKGMRLNVAKLKEGLIDHRNRRIFLGLAGFGFQATIFDVAWPLFVFLAVEKFEAIGFIETAALLISLMLLWSLGRSIDQKGSAILKSGAYLNSLLWLVRAFLLTPLSIFISNVFYGFGSILLWTPFDALVYKHALGKRKLEFFILREILIHLGALTSCLLVWQLLRLNATWFLIFILAIPGLLVTSRISTRE